jgi:hypothetical protein
MNVLNNLSFSKINLARWISGNRTQRDVIALPEVLFDLTGRGIALAEARHDWGRLAVLFFQLYPGICLSTEEKHGKPQSG